MGDDPTGAESLGDEDLVALDALADRFESAWRRGDDPRIEELLDGVASHLLPVFVAELVGIEIELRRAVGELPTLEEYRRRFPDLGSSLESAFRGRGDVPTPAAERETARGRRSAPPSIPHLEVLELLGEGGMASVYRARDLRLDRTVALKVPHRELLSPDHRDRFLQEARAAARLQHPSICPIFEIGEVDDVPYIVMPCVAGEDLGTWRESARPSAREAADVVARVARAVEHAHGHGLVHRDIKPSNVLFSVDDGAAVLMDFGLVLELGADQSRLTQSGHIVGTVAYMSPEQAGGERDLRPSTDIYSLGALLYELLCGRPPFQGSVIEVLSWITSVDPLPPRRFAPSVHRDLETICLKALAKEPERRYPSALALAEDLERFSAGEAIHARRERLPARLLRRVRRQPRVAIAFIAVASLALVTAIWARVAIRKTREGSLVEQALVAELDELPPLLERVKDAGARLEPELRRNLERARGTSRDAERLLRARLALLPLDPAQADPLVDHLLVESTRRFRVLRGLLASYGALVAEPLWSRLLSTREKDLARRLRAAGALALLAPGDARWTELGLEVSEAIVDADPVDRVAWIEIFRPAAARLIPSLLETLERAGDGLETKARVISETLLALEPASARVLARIVRRLGSDGVPGLDERLEAERASVVAELRLLLASGTTAVRPSSAESNLERAVLESIESAPGLVTPSFALCVGLPLDELGRVSAGLLESGYSPRRVRPFRAGDRTHVAAIWVRSKESARVEILDDIRAVRGRDAEVRREGLRVLDASAWTRDDGRRAWALVSSRDGPDVETRLVTELALTPREIVRELGSALDEGFSVQTAQVDLESPENARATFTLARGRDAAFSRLQILSRRDLDRSSGSLQSHLDIAYRRTSSDPGRDPSYLTLLAEAGSTAERVLVDVSPESLVATLRTLESEGLVPRSLSVAPGEGESLRCVAVLEDARRSDGVSDDPRGEARIGAALARLGSPDEVIEMLADATRRDRRSWLLVSLTSRDLSTAELFAALDRSRRVPLRRALCVLIGNGAGRDLDVDTRETLLARLDTLAAEAVDPGLHSAARWAKRRWRAAAGVSDPAADREASSAPSTHGVGGTWFSTAEGQTLVVFDGPHDVVLGSPREERGRDGRGIERLHRRRIPRSFAIGATEVTLAEFLRFRPRHDHSAAWSVDGDCPVGNVSWYDAAAYCNWLSEREGIPESEWCYPSNFAPDVPLPDRWIDRTGYRLPTEGEWELAARGGSSSARFFGDDPALLGSFAWYASNASGHAWPVASRPPNEFGLFDVLGNAMELTMGLREAIPLSLDASRGDEPVFERLEACSTRVVLRGGSVGDGPSLLRSAARGATLPCAAPAGAGFRVARTLSRP